MINILSRNLISPDFILHQENFQSKEVTVITRKQFIGMIDYWKILLVEKYQAKPGQTVMLEFNLTDAYYYSAVFAVWELGMIMIVDWPHAFSYEDATSYRMTMHGKIDFAIVWSLQTDPTAEGIYSYWDHERTRLNCNTIITEKEFDSYQIQDHTKFEEISKTIIASPEVDAVWSASGGTTGNPKQLKITHKEIVLQAGRLVKHLNFVPGENTLHIGNLHHGASLCYHFLPSFMTSKNHYIYSGDQKNSNYHQDLCKSIVDHKINKVLLYSSEKLINFLLHTPRLEHNLDIVTLFYVTKQCVELLHEKNVSSIRNVFGDTTIGYGFLVKIVDKNTDPTTYVTNRIGPKLDDFFDFKIEDEYLYIKAVGLGETEWKTSLDKFNLINKDYHFYGRGTQYRICDEWINLGELDSKVAECFPNDGATVVIDNEEQQLYLSIWKANPEGEQIFSNYLKVKYQHIKVSKIARGLDVTEYTGSRKVDRQKLMQYFRLVAAE